MHRALRWAPRFVDAPPGNGMADNPKALRSTRTHMRLTDYFFSPKAWTLASWVTRNTLPLATTGSEKCTQLVMVFLLS